MNAIILLLPLLLLVTPAVAHGQQATITAPQGTTINNARISVFQPRFLSGTWNFVNGFGNVSGVITFGNQDLCPNCKWNWQHDASFSGIFSGNPVSGTYTWETVPSPPSVYKLAPTSSLSLMYQYHQHATACEAGFFAGYKTWCINHLLNCVENITVGDFPPMLLKAHQEYLNGYNAANGTGASMCPIYENAVLYGMIGMSWSNRNCQTLYNCMTGLVRCAGKYIAKDDYTNVS
jgi:hypothetical protein